MVDREKLQTKIRFQKTKNLIVSIEGIRVIDYKEQNKFDKEYLQNVKYYSMDKTADSKISAQSNDDEIVDWIYTLMNFQIGQIWYLWVNGFLVKIQFLDIRTAILSLWKNMDPTSKGFVLFDENRDTMYEFGNDSRDEENFLFDKYFLSFPPLTFSSLT